MNAAEHIATAERLVAELQGEYESDAEYGNTIARAQVHATLALVMVQRGDTTTNLVINNPASAEDIARVRARLADSSPALVPSVAGDADPSRAVGRPPIAAAREGQTPT